MDMARKRTLLRTYAWSTMYLAALMTIWFIIYLRDSVV